MTSSIGTVAFTLILWGSAGCSQKYVTPGAGITPESLVHTDEEIAERFLRVPAAPFPARMAVLRVQAPGYRSYRTEGYGHGAYCVVTTRDIERDEHFQTLARLPQISALAPLNLLVIPAELKSDKELRLAAASVKADLLLLYSIHTTFRVEGLELGPLHVITLGSLPTNEATVTATASAAILDVRTGYIYALAEGSSKASELTSLWLTDHAVDQSRVKAETDAFTKLLAELQIMWPSVLEEYVGAGAGQGQVAQSAPSKPAE